MKKVVNILIIVLLIFVVSGRVNAAKPDITSNLENERPAEVNVDDEWNQKVGVILGTINVIGSVVSVITLTLIGFKYMIGSVEEKAEYKVTMVPWLIGAVILFSGTALPNFIFGLTKDIQSEEAASPGTPEIIYYCPDCDSRVYYGNYGYNDGQWSGYWCLNCKKYVSPRTSPKEYYCPKCNSRVFWGDNGYHNGQWNGYWCTNCQEYVEAISR